MYCKRKIDGDLGLWFDSPHRKPLVLRGARQTGKSSSVRNLGERAPAFLELNLERYTDLSLVRGCRSAEELVAALRSLHNISQLPRNTLLFIDEIQEHPEAIQWLRFFAEDHPDLAVVAAGSLLEVRLQDRGFSFPVGRVTFLTLRPFSFGEFLGAIGRDVLLETLKDRLCTLQELPPAVHEQATELFKEYLVVGGMPEAIVRWIDTRNHRRVAEVHGDLQQAFAEDIQKYSTGKDLGYIEAAFENMRHHYGARFRYESFAPGFHSAQMKKALTKLEGALLITRVWPTSSTRFPFEVRARSAPKLLPLDSGMALFELHLGFQNLMHQAVDRILDGKVAELSVGLLRLTATHRRRDLMFWVAESSRNNAEVDYFEDATAVPLPVEVKAGATGSLKSLHQNLHDCGLSTGVRFCSSNISDERLSVKMGDGRLNYRLLSLPHYLAEFDLGALIEGDASP